MTPLTVDAHTLLLALSFMFFWTAAFALSSAGPLSGSRYGLIEWAKSMAAAGGAFILFFLRGHAPEFFTVLIANTLALFAPIYSLKAYAKFFAVNLNRKLIGAICAFGMTSVLLVYIFKFPRVVVVFSLSLEISVIYAIAAMLFLRHQAILSRASFRLAVVTLVVTSTAFGIRAIFSLFGAGASVAIDANTPPQLFTLFASGLCALGASMSLILMVHDRQRQESIEGLRRDALTGLYTRTAFFELAKGTIDKARGGYALVMIDIDNFKLINDTQGHSGGDTVLRHAGNLILRSVRSMDMAGRYGGEEFCIALPGCAIEQAKYFAERLVLECSKQTVRFGTGVEIKFTISAGYACQLEAHTENGQPEGFVQVLERADAALYEAKRSGRNRAVASAKNATSIGESKLLVEPLSMA